MTACSALAGFAVTATLVIILGNVRYLVENWILALRKICDIMHLNCAKWGWKHRVDETSVLRNPWLEMDKWWSIEWRDASYCGHPPRPQPSAATLESGKDGASTLQSSRFSVIEPENLLCHSIPLANGGVFTQTALIDKPIDLCQANQNTQNEALRYRKIYFASFWMQNPRR